ncbi:hypothetical protein ACIQMR_00675 [Streptomyces sp. NPDC091376]|uniref:hypothetical protein n=1 Tax=Streptomyces sp. NPDC091376 TaxID=3365994 RepID=UPI003801238A
MEPALLAARAATVPAGTTDGGTRTVAAAVVSRDGAVVGISDLFAVDDDLDAARAGCLAAVACFWPGVRSADTGTAALSPRGPGRAVWAEGLTTAHARS